MHLLVRCSGVSKLERATAITSRYLAFHKIEGQNLAVLILTFGRAQR
jgi:hypothetical protein